MRSLDSNIHELRNFVNTQKEKDNQLPSIITLSETWLVNEEQATIGKYQIDNYELVVKCRENAKNSRGGTGMYISKELCYKRKAEITTRFAESVWIEVTTQNKKNILIGSIYSSPIGRNTTEFIEDLNKILETINTKKQDAIILGDLNIDMFTLKEENLYYTALLSNYFHSLIRFPTRTTNTSETLIDHIISNIECLKEPALAGIIINNISDHYTTYASIPLIDSLEKESTENRGKVFTFKNFSRERAAQELAETDWNFITSQTSVDQAYTDFIGYIREIQFKYMYR